MIINFKTSLSKKMNYYNPLRYAVFLVLLLSNAAILFAFQTSGETGADEIISLSEDGSWCWFQDNRAILDGDMLLFSGVTSSGKNTVTRYNLVSGEKNTVTIQENILPADDHNVAILMRRPDGKYLTVYAGHGIDSLVRYRVSSLPGEIGEWEAEKQIKTIGRVTYSNVYRLSDSGITYNFYRGNQNNPHYLLSRDDGDTWEFGGRLFEYPGRSYLRYASDNTGRIHFTTTEDHPRHYNNSIYHGYIEDGQVYRSDGRVVGDLSTTGSSKLKPTDFTPVYDGDRRSRMDVAWTSDIHLDEKGYPYIVFSVTKDPITRGETKNTGLGGFDHRYHYARWDGQQWREYEIAYAGSRLYPGENEYTGLISLHPKDPDIVYISSDVYPDSGKPILVNGERRYEIFKGQNVNQGRNWKWTPVTAGSQYDNIRPIVLADDRREVVIWLNGRYTAYTDYQLSVMGIVRE